MIGVHQMSEFVDEDIINDWWWIMDKVIVEVEVVIGRTAAPETSLVFDADASIRGGDMHELMQSGETRSDIGG